MFPWNLGFWLLLGFAWQLLWPFQWFSHQILLCYEQEGHLHAWRPFPGVATLRSGKQKSTGKGYWMILGPVASCSWSNGQSSHLYNGGCATWHAWHVSCTSGQIRPRSFIIYCINIYGYLSFIIIYSIRFVHYKMPRPKFRFESCKPKASNLFDSAWSRCMPNMFSLSVSESLPYLAFHFHNLPHAIVQIHKLQCNSL